MPNKKKRLDVMLREWNLAPSRAKAQELIAAGAVEVYERGQWLVIRDEAHQVDATDAKLVRVQPNPILDYVSRGGRKLEGALDDLKLSPQSLRVLDIGISTGGFSHCLLRRGAALVVGVDVGHDQLAKELLNEPRLRHFEGVNARDLRRNAKLEGVLRDPFDLVVADVSFISLTQILSEAASVLRPGGFLLALVKPQFEVSAKDLNKKGVVTDLELHDQVRDKMTAAAVAQGLKVLKYFASCLPGQDGNQEYFIYAQKL